LRSIGKIGRSEVLPAIESVLPSADGLLMITCLELLEAVGSRKAMDMVETALESHDREIVALAVSILARQGGEWVTTNAERFIAHSNEAVRIVWTGVLAGLPPQQARQFLSQAIKQEVNSQIKARMQNLLEGIA
jgi:hypothetical protein